MGKLFGSSGVRGLINRDLTPALAAKIGLALATFTKPKRVFVARDTRVTGLMVENALISGLLAGGVDVDSLDMLPTPALAYLTKESRADYGVMITASHNPPQYNGIKIFNHDSVSIDEKTQDRIEKIVESGSFKPAEWRDVGRASHVNKSFHYAEMILDKVELQKNWRIIVDPGCGATYALAPEILTKLGCHVTAFNAQPDGFFPARSSEPNEESLESLTKLVREFNADVGIAYDGDGDRVAFIDERGRFADFDLVLAAYAGYVAKKEKGGIAVTNVEASMCFEKTVTAHHGKVVRTKVGDVYLSEAMKRHGAVFGGEPCGAWIHPQFHYCPDGILSSVLLLKALEDEKKKFSEFIAEIPKFLTLREKVACRNEKKYTVVEEIGERLKSVFSRYIEFSKIDGFRLTLDGGWILVRASGTEPLIRLTVEGESLKTAKNMMDKALGLTKETIRRKNP